MRTHSVEWTLKISGVELTEDARHALAVAILRAAAEHAGVGTIELTVRSEVVSFIDEYAPRL